MQEILPVDQGEYDLLTWWFSHDSRSYHYQSNLRFSLERRPKSVGALINHWSNALDTARHFYRVWQQHGHLF